MIRKTNLANRGNYGSSRSTSAIKYIVLHYTSNDGDTDESNGKYFHNNDVDSSAHYFVDSDSVTQSVPDNYVAWAVGGKKYPSCAQTGGGKFYGKCTNTNSLSIEMCDDKKDGTVQASDKTIANAQQLTRELMKKYNVPLENVIRHFDVVGKLCPAYYVDEAKWATFKAGLEEDDMTKEEVIKIIEEYEAEKAKKAVSSWAKTAWAEAKANGILDGTAPQSGTTREQIAVILSRLGLLK